MVPTPGVLGSGWQTDGARDATTQHFVLSQCVLPAVLPAAALASGHSNINVPVAVPTWEGAQPGELALPVCPGQGRLLKQDQGRVPQSWLPRDLRPGSWLCSHPFPPTGPGAGHIMQVVSPRYFLCFVGPWPVPAPLPLQPSREAGGPGRHSDSRHIMWRLPAWVSHDGGA